MDPELDAVIDAATRLTDDTRRAIRARDAGAPEEKIASILRPPYRCAPDNVDKQPDRPAFTLGEFLSIPFLERMRKLKELPAEEANAIHEEMRKRQQAVRDSHDGPVYRYRPSVEEGRCIDPDDFED